MQKQKGFILPVVIAVIIIAILGAGGYFVYKQYSAPKLTPTACTQEAKICPDGSAVGRTGPNCEFASCPAVINPTAGPALSGVEGWKTYTNTQYGFEIKYPETDTANRIYPPEEVQLNLPISEVGMHTNIDAKILHVIVKPKNNNSACVGPNYYSKTNNVIINGIQFAFGGGGEGAAGHGYNYTDYTTEKNNTCITMSFVISSYNDLQIPTYSGGKPYAPYDYSKELPIFDQIMATFKFTNASNQPKITILSPKGGETWQMGTNQTIKFSTSSNMPGAATCVDAYAVDTNGNKNSLSLGSYISIAEKNGGVVFKLGIGDSDSIVPGVYKIELDVHSCAETNNTFITSANGNGFITVIANPNFIKPSITQISPSQGGENDVITISGNNLSSVVGIQFSPIGRSPADTGWTAYANILSKSQNSVTFGFTNLHGELPTGTYQVNVMSPTGRSNLLNFTFSGQ